MAYTTMSIRIDKDAEYFAVEPYTVLVEVVAAIKRRTASELLAEKIRNNLQGIDSICFLDLESNRANEASNLAKRYGMRGMDAIVDYSIKTSFSHSPLLRGQDSRGQVGRVF